MLGAFLFALLIALVLTLVFSAGMGRTGPWGAWWWFFVIILVAAFVAALWMPIGPVVWGVAWLPALWVALLFALLIAAATPESRRTVRTTSVERTAAGERVRPEGMPEERLADTEEEAAGAAVALGLIFWIFLLLLIVPAILSVFW